MNLYFQNLLKCFIKRDALPQTPYKLVKLDVVDQAMWMNPKDVDIGMGATAVIKVGYCKLFDKVIAFNYAYCEYIRSISYFETV